MAWDEIWKVASAVIVSFGGAGVITIAVVKYATGMITKRIEQKYEAKLDKELEKYKTLLGEKTYVTKARFDTEFQAFKDINKAMFEATVALSSYGVALNQSLIDGNIQIFIGLYTSGNPLAVHGLASFQSAVVTNAAFIEPRIYQKYKDILSLCGEQFRHFDDCLGDAGEGKTLISYSADLNIIDKRKADIDSKIDEVNTMVRDYLDNLVVIS